MPMAFKNLRGSVNLVGQRSRSEFTFIGTQAHRPTQIAIFVTDLFGTVLVPFGHQAYNRFAIRSELRGPGIFNAADIAHRFNNSHLHTKTNA